MFILLNFFLFPSLTESDESPGMYLRDDYLGGPTELRAPTAERAALFLDAALAGRTSSIYEPALIFTLHVYQYSLAGKGGGELIKWYSFRSAQKKKKKINKLY